MDEKNLDPERENSLHKIFPPKNTWLWVRTEKFYLSIAIVALEQIILFLTISYKLRNKIFACHISLGYSEDK